MAEGGVTMMRHLFDNGKSCGNKTGAYHSGVNKHFARLGCIYGSFGNPTPLIKIIGIIIEAVSTAGLVVILKAS